MPEEMRFVLRSALYSLGVGLVYWFLTYEAAGTILLVGLGVAAAVLLGVMWHELRRKGRRIDGRPWSWLALPAADAESDFTDESGRIPRPTLAPLSVAGGVALIGLGLVFGLPMLAAAVIPIVVGVRAWIGDAMAEHEATEREAAENGAAL